MDQLQISNETAEALGKMSPADKQELNQFIMGETQKAQIQTTVHDLTNVCFRKCVAPGRISSGRLDRGEEPCLQNCVDRWMDSQMTVLRHLEQLRQG